MVLVVYAWTAALSCSLIMQILPYFVYILLSCECHAVLLYITHMEGCTDLFIS